MSVYLDTSALAKLYVNEPGSEEFAAYFAGIDRPIISTLVVTEMRSLLARHRRLGHVGAGFVADAMDLLRADVEDGRLHQLPVRDAQVRAATYLIARLESIPLRTLDALHLSLCEAHGLPRLATADDRMANAAAAMKIEVARF